MPAKGDRACYPYTLSEVDFISQHFYDKHICKIMKNKKPLDLSAFCRDFRPGETEYQVMLLATPDIRRLRLDLQRHQADFYNDRSLLTDGQVYYTTDDPYTFIYCEKSMGKWIGKEKSFLYMQYIPRGTFGDPEGLYRIFHGCGPVETTYPGFRHCGTCLE